MKMSLSLNMRLDGALALEGKGDPFAPDTGIPGYKIGQTAHFTENSKQDLQPVADFMDKNPKLFGKPDSGSWSNELKEDNFLDKKETEAFEKGMSLFKSAHADDGKNDLGGGAYGGAGSMRGAGSQQGLGNDLLSQFPMLENLLKDLQGLLGQDQSHLSPAKGIAASSRLDGAITPKDGDQTGDKGGYFTDESATELKPVAYYMDAHPEKFGKPDSGSWAQELKEDNYLDKDEFNKFQKGIADVKDGIHDNAFSFGGVHPFGSSSEAQEAGRLVVNQLFA
jgi:hypothetical protein